MFHGTTLHRGVQRLVAASRLRLDPGSRERAVLAGAATNARCTSADQPFAPR
jgi:hypothetical protein